MTNRDIFTTIFAEATGATPDQVRQHLETFLAALPLRPIGLDAVLSDDQAAAILAGLRQELPSIRQWIQQRRPKT